MHYWQQTVVNVIVLSQIAIGLVLQIAIVLKVRAIDEYY